ncbi:hypothetical protein EEB15_27105 [Ramlibacter sp. WS9]|nr:hypothetical protein EEB15_27105 [Ramlibacter sp. WS9]
MGLDRLRYLDLVAAFAKKSHDALIESGKTNRLRQCTKIHIRVSDEDLEVISNALRSLVDAGILVLIGYRERVKDRGREPYKQIIVAFRKLLGVAFFMPLSDRDRIELSSREFLEWLAKPSLLNERELISNIDDQELDAGVDDDVDLPQLESFKPRAHPIIEEADQNASAQGLLPFSSAGTKPIATDIVHLNEIKFSDIELWGAWTYLGALGVEERTEVAHRRFAAVSSMANVVAVQYGQSGRGENIKRSWHRVGKVPTLTASSDALSIELPERTVIDISGLTKRLIFGLIRKQFLKYGRVFVSITAAEQSVPSVRDIENILFLYGSGEIAKARAALQAVVGNIESGPYTAESVIENISDPTRDRALISFLSSRHERILALLEQRTYEHIELIYSKSDEKRGHLAEILGRQIGDFVSSVSIEGFDSNHQLPDLIGRLLQIHKGHVLGSKSNVEIALTGTKTQAVAAAIASTLSRFSCVWYLAPASISTISYTEGAGATTIFELSEGDGKSHPLSFVDEE